MDTVLKPQKSKASTRHQKYFPPILWPVLRSLENARRNLEKAVRQGEMIDPDSAWLGEIKKEYAYVRRLLNGMVSAAIETNRGALPDSATSPGSPCHLQTPISSNRHPEQPVNHRQVKTHGKITNGSVS